MECRKGRKFKLGNGQKISIKNTLEWLQCVWRRARRNVCDRLLHYVTQFALDQFDQWQCRKGSSIHHKPHHISNGKHTHKRARFIQITADKRFHFSFTKPRTSSFHLQCHANILTHMYAWLISLIKSSPVCVEFQEHKRLVTEFLSLACVLMFDKLWHKSFFLLVFQRKKSY